jgi:hypothetical protein
MIVLAGEWAGRPYNPLYGRWASEELGFHDGLTTSFFIRGDHSMERNLANRIAILKVQTGAADVGCDPNGVQIFYQESTIRSGDPNAAYLGGLLRKHGFQIKEGKRLTDHPMRYLCVSQGGSSVTVEDVLKVLGEDEEIDLSDVNRPAGNWRSE